MESHPANCCTSATLNAGLIGPWPAMQQRYLDRSPALHAEKIVAPVLVQQGAEDRIVPPAEAERIVDALWERRVPHA